MAKHTQLYDYKAKEPVLLGGTHSQFSTDDGVTWLPLKGAQELGDIGDIAESVECTTTEFNYWSVFFQEEYYEEHPHERYRDGMTESNCAGEIEKFRKLMQVK